MHPNQADSLSKSRTPKPPKVFTAEVGKAIGHEGRHAHHMVLNQGPFGGTIHSLTGPEARLTGILSLLNPPPPPFGYFGFGPVCCDRVEGGIVSRSRPLNATAHRCMGSGLKKGLELRLYHAKRGPPSICNRSLLKPLETLK